MEAPGGTPRADWAGGGAKANGNGEACAIQPNLSQSGVSESLPIRSTAHLLDTSTNGLSASRMTNGNSGVPEVTPAPYPTSPRGNQVAAPMRWEEPEPVPRTKSKARRWANSYLATAVLRVLDIIGMLAVGIYNALQLDGADRISALGYAVLIVSYLAAALDMIFLVFYVVMLIRPFGDSGRIRARAVEAIISAIVAVTLFVLGIWAPIANTLGYQYAPLAAGYSLRFIFNVVIISRLSIAAIFACFAVCHAACVCACVWERVRFLLVKLHR